jgi:hypothetical protein
MDDPLVKLWAKITLGTVAGFVVIGGIGNAIDPNPAPTNAASSTTIAAAATATTDAPPPPPPAPVVEAPAPASPVAAPPVQAAPPVPAPVDVRNDPAVVDAVYVMALDQRGIHYASKEAAIRLGHRICEGYQVGATTLQIADAMKDSSYTQEEIGFIIGDAAQAYCPEYANY